MSEVLFIEVVPTLSGHVPVCACGSSCQEVSYRFHTGIGEAHATFAVVVCGTVEDPHGRYAVGTFIVVQDTAGNIHGRPLCVVPHYAWYDDVPDAIDTHGIEYVDGTSYIGEVAFPWIIR